MLHVFLTNQRAELIERCRAKVAKRASPEATADEMDHGVPFFLDQLIKTLKVEQTDKPMESRKVSGASGGGKPALSELSEVAAQHGRELLRRGFTVEQVVHDYGDLCQSITDLAFEVDEPVEVDEFRTLNRCLDNAIAMAVTEFNYQRDFVMADKHIQTLNVQIGFFTHELRNLLNTATLALFAIKDGNLSLSGATGSVLNRSLVGMGSLIDRSLTDVRLIAGLPVRNALFALSDFIGEIKLSAALEAKVKECVLTVSAVDLRLALDADRDLLLSAVGNLLQNAFKFTHRGTEVILNAYSVGDRILIDVEDHGDGLPPGEAETMFEPFTQGGKDKSGMGLGLSIARRGVEANDGILSVRNKPDEQGCVFTIDLPRHAMPLN
ncbi:HAMP domain-containing histidine kinase [Phragmitibacter flavus]|uniref:histidine kinase n=1 Tax=Phragmitibacter flavus TaxID=2576071 RepID=A0A5R8KAR1_9BACT|nr:HAMP domain-containing sensor histidine kinase [Phragmitibacter flavus]TLD69386.1 HAMP domain-containing histidine kinase [Phragmitibacter flavus]